MRFTAGRIRRAGRLDRNFALAAYNGGAGNALRWMNRDRAIDPDLFVESIDFDETALYVRTVMEAYGVYRMLYGGGG